MIYAHSKIGMSRDQWQLLEKHLQSVGKLAASFAEMFRSGDWAWNAGWLHDLGKADKRFQAYLARSNGLDDSEYDAAGRVNHSSAGAAYAEDGIKNVSGRTLAYVVAGHHAGLPDWYSVDSGLGALSARLAEGRDNLQQIEKDVTKYISILRSAKPPEFVHPANYHLWVRMLYSCLVDADYLDTESFMEPDQSGKRAGFAQISTMKNRFDRHMERKTLQCENTPVNAARRGILEACRKMAEQQSGLYSLTVPTGGGKTLSGMAFALDHVLKRGKRRIIYVIPYTSIIEQTAGILREIFGDDNVVEHHSNLDPEKETQRSRLASQNWDAPIIVTTNVQFFESLYADRSSRCRKLHNIVNSVVILDEAQLIPPELLQPCVHAIEELTQNYGVTVLLSTATQPVLEGLKAIEIVDDPDDLYKRLKRTDISFSENLNESVSWADLAARLVQYEQVLCVVNSRKDCYDLYNYMPERTIHLSALMCGRHRSEKIKEIKGLLKNNLPVRVISTQLVEAGVDIDFPVVYRAFAGLDSIVQAAGRCNREGKLPGMGQVHVFVPPTQPSPGLLRKAAGKTRELIGLGKIDPQDPATFRKFFKLFYSSVNDTGEEILRDLSKDVDNRSANVPFRKIGGEFKLIDDWSKPVIVKYENSEELIQKLRYAGPTREIMQQLQRFTVNLSPHRVGSLLADGRLEEITDEKAQGIVIQGLMKYDAATGLDVFNDSLPPDVFVQ